MKLFQHLFVFFHGRISLLISMLLLITISAGAQIVVNLQLPPSGILQKNQLWNMVVVNGSGEHITMQIELNVFDSRTGNRVLSAVSGVLSVKPGAKQLRMNDLMPVQYQYSNSLYQVDASVNGLLPVGMFKVCYNFFKQSSKGNEPMFEECREIEIAPISPPLLMMPEDSAVIKNTYPQFSWLPPTPLQSFKGLNYELRVVEIQKGQNSTEAIQKNITHAEKGGLKETFYSYPSSLPTFDTSVLYAWQITAFDASGYSAKSEVWTFSLEKNVLKRLKVTNSFVWLTRGEDPSLFISNGRIKFSYDNLFADSVVTYRLVYTSGKTEQVMRKGVLKISGGQNFMELNLEDKRFWRENELYRFELLNSKGQSWKLNIKFIEKEENQ